MHPIIKTAFALGYAVGAIAGGLLADLLHHLWKF
jgi:hypothetical protein